MFLDKFEKKNCCGCSACDHICGRKAIQMQQDDEGYKYPVVDKSKCVDCGMCEKVCPFMDNYVGIDASPDIYAVHNKNRDVVFQSSSGGMFSLLAEWIINQGGSVYGVAFNDDYYVQHMKATTMEDAARFRTSKYVESDVTKIYEEVKADVASGNYVLFTGTPCQVSAMIKFLTLRRVNLDRFYTCDNICHGVPSPKVWKDYLDIVKDKYISKEDKIAGINMRSKKTSWKKQNMVIELEKGNIDEVINEFSFNQLFLSLYTNKPSCFSCRYTSYKRVADFTLGDFWNVENAGVTFDTEGGVNLVLVNTDKGKEVFDIIKENVDYKAVTKEQCWQPHLEYSAKAPAKQAEFWDEYNRTDDKEMVMRKYMKGSLVTRIIHRLTPIIRKIGLYKVAGKVYKRLIVRKKSNHE